MKKIMAKLGVNNKESFYKLIKQAFKFALVGLSNTLISLLVYYGIVAINPKLYLFANIIGFFVSTANSFFWNYRYVFKKEYEKDASMWQRFFKPLIKTYLAYGTTLLLGLAMLYAQVEWWGVSEMLAPIINLLVTIPINFVVNKLWAYK